MKKCATFFLAITVSIFGIPAENHADQLPLMKEARGPELGEAIRLTPEKLPQLKGVPADRTGGWVLDPANRQLSRAFYNSVYMASESTPINWDGDTGTCNQGTTAADFKNAVLARINYYRAMSGVSADITFSDTYSSKAQQAALMMSRNNSLSHSPPTIWSCYSPEGAEAADNSNLSLGKNGWAAVDGQMRDNGSTNTEVGHRRWLLYPQTQMMGTGDVPLSASYYPANALWVFDDNLWTSRPSTREAYVAWPPPGYVPYPIVPARWSFSYANANFSSATVSVSQGGAPVSVALHPVQNGYGENTIVWVMGDMDPDGYESWPNPVQDEHYTVQISGVIINGTPTSFSYDVVIMDPSARGEDELFPEIDANINPRVGEQKQFTFSAVPFAHSYEVLQTSLQIGDTPEGGENGLDAVIDGTSPAYPLLIDTASASGSYSFHLVHPVNQIDQNEFFELDRTFIPSVDSILSFKSRLGYATANQHALAQISVDDGTSWKTLYDQSGNNSYENNFTEHAISLGDYANIPIRIRYSYQFGIGSYYPCIESNCGFLVDDIVVSNSQEFSDAMIIPANNDLSFSFTRQTMAPHAFAVRTIAWEGYPALEWGPLYFLPTAPTQVGLPDVIERLKLLAAESESTTLAEVIGILQVIVGH